MQVIHSQRKAEKYNLELTDTCQLSKTLTTKSSIYEDLTYMQGIHSSRLEIMKTGHMHFTKERAYSIQKILKVINNPKKGVSGIMHHQLPL